jgi:iron complex outermembrane receptor protein
MAGDGQVRWRLMATSAVAAVMGLPCAAQAQASDTAPPALEEIVITADTTGTKAVQVGSFRGAKQLDTPLTISVIPREVLDIQMTRSILDALRNTPGVTPTQTAPTVYSNIAIRGIPVENRGNYRLNGTLPIINLTDLPLEDKERVEALKGASALYYGFTTPSGIINLTMKRPTNEPFVGAELFGNSHGAIGGHVDVGGTRGIFGYRVNAVYDKPDPGIDHTRGTRTLLAGAFDIKPMDDLEIQLDGERIYKKLNEPGIYRFLRVPATTVANPYPTIALPRLTDASTNFGPDFATNRTKASNLLAKAIWRISPQWEFVGSAGLARLFRERHFNTIDPNDPNTNPLTGAVGEYPLSVSYQPVAKFRNENLRAELTGTFNTGPLTHEILIGASSNTRENRSSVNQAQQCLYSSTTGALIGGTFATTAGAGQIRAVCRQSIANPHDIPQLPEPLNVLNNPTQIRDLGVYVFDRIKYGEWLQLLAGVRKSDYQEKRLDTGVKTFKAKPTSLSGGVVIKPIKAVSVYATYIEGLESTPGAPLTAVNANEQLGPSQSTQYEAGVKWEILPTLLFQSAYFDIKRDSAIVNGANVYVKDGRQSYKGVELSLTGKVTDDLSIYASALYLDAKYTSGSPTALLFNANGTPRIDAASGSQLVAPTIVGKRVEGAPKTSWSVSAEYKLSALLEGLAVNGGVFHISKQAINPLNQNFIPGYTTLDLGASYNTEIQGHDTTFRVYGTNVTGKKYFASTGALFAAQAGPPTVKFSVSTEF